MLEDVLAPGASRLRERAPAVERVPIGAHAATASRRGDLYRTPGAASAGIVLVPGLAPAGKDDGRVVALARTLVTEPVSKESKSHQSLLNVRLVSSL